MIDLDPQANATTGLGLKHAQAPVTSYDLLLGMATLGDASRPTLVPNLMIVPTSVHLSGAELELVDLFRREYRLKDALAAHGRQLRICA